MSASPPKSSLKLPHVSYGERLQPSRDWYAILIVGAVLLGLSVGWNLWLFAQITAGGSIGQNTSTPAVSQSQLDHVKALFDARAAEQQRYLHEYHFVDPSVGAGSVKTVATTSAATTTAATSTAVR